MLHHTATTPPPLSDHPPTNSRHEATPDRIQRDPGWRGTVSFIAQTQTLRSKLRDATPRHASRRTPRAVPPPHVSTIEYGRNEAITRARIHIHAKRPTTYPHVRLSFHARVCMWLHDDSWLTGKADRERKWDEGVAKRAGEKRGWGWGQRGWKRWRWCWRQARSMPILPFNNSWVQRKIDGGETMHAGDGDF